MNKTLIMVISDNNLESINRAILEIENIENADMLIIDEASDYDIIEELGEFQSVKCIVHDLPLGYGSSLAEAINYAQNFEYNYLITAQYRSKEFRNNIDIIQKNLEYGYDIVTCSRLLENYNYEKIDDLTINILENIADSLNSITDLDITDPLSPDKGLNIRNMANINVTDEGQGALLQLLIQGSYFAYSIFEIPSEENPVLSNNDFDNEAPLEVFLSIIETEKFLYNKRSIN